MWKGIFPERSHKPKKIRLCTLLLMNGYDMRKGTNVFVRKDDDVCARDKSGLGCHISGVLETYRFWTQREEMFPPPSLLYRRPVYFITLRLPLPATWRRKTPNDSTHHFHSGFTSPPSSLTSPLK